VFSYIEDVQPVVPCITHGSHYTGVLSFTEEADELYNIKQTSSVIYLI